MFLLPFFPVINNNVKHVCECTEILNILDILNTILKTVVVFNLFNEYFGKCGITVKIVINVAKTAVYRFTKRKTIRHDSQFRCLGYNRVLQLFDID